MYEDENIIDIVLLDGLAADGSVITLNQTPEDIAALTVKDTTNPTISDLTFNTHPEVTLLSKTIPDVSNCVAKLSF